MILNVKLKMLLKVKMILKLDMLLYLKILFHLKMLIHPFEPSCLATKMSLKMSV